MLFKNSALLTRGDFSLLGNFTADNTLELDFGGTVDTFNLADGPNTINLASLGLAEVDLDIELVPALDETGELFTIDFDVTQTVEVSDGIAPTVSNVDISSGSIDLGDAVFSNIFVSDPGFDLDVDLSDNGNINTMTIQMTGPRAQVTTAFGDSPQVLIYPMV